MDNSVTEDVHVPGASDAATALTSRAQPLPVRRRGRYSKEVWDNIKPIIQRLYSVENQTYQVVMEALRTRWNFTPTRRQFYGKIYKWRLQKNVKENEMRAIVQDTSRERFIGNDNAVKVRGRRVDVEKIRRWKKKQERTMGILHQFPNSSAAVTTLVGPSNSATRPDPSAPALGAPTFVEPDSSSCSVVTESSRTVSGDEQNVQGQWISDNITGFQNLPDLFDALEIEYGSEVPPTFLYLEYGISPFPILPTNSRNVAPYFGMRSLKAQSMQTQEEERRFRKRLHKSEMIFSPDSCQILKFKCDLATFFWEACKVRSAEDLYRQVAQSMEKTLGIEHLDTLSVYLKVIKAIISRGGYLEAEELHKKIHATILRLFEPEKELALESTSLMADILYYLEKDLEADKLRRQVLQIRLNSLGLRSGQTLIAMRKVASMLTVSDQLLESEKILHKIVQLHNEVVGISEKAILHDVRQLADALRDQERYRESEILFRQIADRSKTSFGPDHPDTLWSYSGIAYCLSSQGLLQESEHLLQTTYDQQLKVLGDRDPETVLTMCELANVREKTGRHQEALTLRETIFQGAAEKYGRSHPRTVLRCHQLGKCYEALRRFEEAFALYRRLATELRDIDGDEHPMALEVNSWVADLQPSLAKWQSGDRDQDDPDGQEDLNGDRNLIEEEDTSDEISIEDDEDAETGRVALVEDWMDDFL